MTYYDDLDIVVGEYLEAVPQVDYIRINHCNKKILIYKHRVAVGFTSADDKVGDKPPPYAN